MFDSCREEVAVTQPGFVEVAYNFCIVIVLYSVLPCSEPFVKCRRCIKLCLDFIHKIISCRMTAEPG